MKMRIYAAAMFFAIWLLTVLAAFADDDKNDIIGEVENEEILKILDDADSIFRLRDYVNSRRHYQKAFEASKKDGYNSGLTEAAAMIARTYLLEKNEELAVSWLNAAAKLALKQEPLGWSRFQAVKGRYLWHDNKMTEATDLFKRLYYYCSSNRLPERAVDAAHMVAITGDHKDQIEWARKGINEAEYGQITGWLGPLWNNLGVTYEEMGKYDSSLAAYLKARKYHYLYGTEANKVIADWAVGHAYLNLEDYTKAEEWLAPLLARFRRMEDIEFVGLTARDLGDIYRAQGKNEKALEFYIVAEENLDRTGMDDWDPQGFQEIRSLIRELKNAEN